MTKKSHKASGKKRRAPTEEDVQGTHRSTQTSPIGDTQSHGLLEPQPKKRRQTHATCSRTEMTGVITLHDTDIERERESSNGHFSKIGEVVRGDLPSNGGAEYGRDRRQYERHRTIPSSSDDRAGMSDSDDDVRSVSYHTISSSSDAESHNLRRRLPAKESMKGARKRPGKRINRPNPQRSGRQSHKLATKPQRRQ